MRHNRRADVEIGSQSSDVVEVRVRTDQPANRLVRRQSCDLLNDHEAAFRVARRLEHSNEVVELHHVAIGGAAA